MEKIMGRVVAVLFGFSLMLGMMPALTVDAATDEDIDVLLIKYNAKMAFDCQRRPAVPRKGAEEWLDTFKKNN